MFLLLRHNPLCYYYYYVIIFSLLRHVVKTLSLLAGAGRPLADENEPTCGRGAYVIIITSSLLRHRLFRCRLFCTYKHVYQL